MKLTKIIISILLTAALTSPAMASSDWVDDFLHRYDPSTTGASGPETAKAVSLGQLLRTGEVPVTMNDVINMLLDNNLDVRADRFAPRSSYYQALVFYRALLPSLRIAMMKSAPTSGRNVVTERIGQLMLNSHESQT